MSGTTAAKGVRHIIDNLQYPDYIRNHPVFQKLSKITKVFPGIGLPNMTEDCIYSNLVESKQDAINLLNGDIRNSLNRAGDLVYNSAPLMRDIFYALVNEIASYYNSMIVESDGKIALNFKRDIGLMPDGKAYFARNGESVFKVYNKVVEKCKELGHTLVALESMPSFKAFSTSNVPGGRKFKMVFSSSGEEGAWDIATISMRGISSCQSWGSSQSRGLIGSISSKYVGVAYITSGDMLAIPNGVGKGSKMLRRAMVRFCINKNTKKPALLVDRIYPGDDLAARGVFREFLSKKSNLPVLFPGDPEWTQYYLPVDECHKLAQFQANELTYMDNKIPYKAAALPPKDCTPFYNRVAQLDQAIMAKVHNTIVRKLTEYCADKKMHRSEFRGGVANLILSLKKHVSPSNMYFIGHCIPKLYNQTPAIVANGLMPNGSTFDNGKDYERAAIKKAFANMKQLETASHESLKRIGKFMKFYPDSASKLHKQIMTEYKKELVLVYKDLLRN